MDIETFTVELPGQLLTGAYVLGAWPREIIEVEVPFQPPTTLALDIFEISDKRRILVCTELACNQGRSCELQRSSQKLTGNATCPTSLPANNYSD